MWLALAIAAACGVVVGILSGLLGIGGGALVIPLMRLGFGLPPLTVTGTSLFTIFFTSISGISGRIRNKTICLKMGIVIGLGGMICSPLGVLLSDCIGGTATILLAIAFIAYSAIDMVRKAISISKADAKGEPIEFMDITTFKLTASTVLKALLVGAFAGFFSGLIGVGGGFIITPMIMWLFNMSLRDASGTTLMAICMIAVPGVVSKALLGQIDFIRGLAVAAGSIPGAQLGAKLASKVPEKTLRIFFAAFLLVISAYMAIGEFL